MMYKIYKQFADIDFSSRLTLSQSAARGDNSRFLRHSCNTNVYSNSFFPRTIRDWNSLPSDPSLRQTVDTFKSY